MQFLITIAVTLFVGLINPMLGFIAFLICINVFENINKQASVKERIERERIRRLAEVDRVRPIAEKLIVDLRTKTKTGDLEAQAVLGQALMGLRFHRDKFFDPANVSPLINEMGTDITFADYPELHNANEGVELIKAAAQHDGIIGQIILGTLYMNGLCVAKNESLGETLIRNATVKAQQRDFEKRAICAVDTATGPGFEENLKYQTKRGEMVRSKSELRIANLLFDAGIVYHYERPWTGYTRKWSPSKYSRGTRNRLQVYKTFKAPDFTFYTPNGDWVIWEHVGMLDNYEYRNNWNEKLKWYQDNDLQIGKNLFISTNDNEINKVLSKIKKLYQHAGTPTLDLAANNAQKPEPVSIVGHTEISTHTVDPNRLSHQRERTHQRREWAWIALSASENSKVLAHVNKDKAKTLARELAKREKISTRIRNVNNYYVVDIQDDRIPTESTLRFVKEIAASDGWVTADDNQ